MSKTRVITDTDSNLPVEWAKKFNIILVPITIQFGEESYDDTLELQNNELFEKIDKSGKLPTTAAPSPAAFASAFKQAFDEGAESIICVCVGSKVSRTYESALAAVEEFPGKKIDVLDSQFVSIGQGMLAMEAADALAKGASHDEALAKAKAMMSNLVLYGSLATLKYLALGGRVSTIAASMANMLNIRPILTMKDGKLDLLEKVRTRKAAMDRLVELLVSSADGKNVERAYIIHVLNSEDAEILKTRLCEELSIENDIPMIAFGPGLSVHAGVGLVGAVLLTSD